MQASPRHWAEYCPCKIAFGKKNMASNFFWIIFYFSGWVRFPLGHVWRHWLQWLHLLASLVSLVLLVYCLCWLCLVSLALLALLQDGRFQPTATTNFENEQTRKNSAESYPNRTTRRVVSGTSTYSFNTASNTQKQVKTRLNISNNKDNNKN